MAKGSSLSDAIQNMIDNVEQVSAMTALIVKEKVKQDFEKAAKESVDKYYQYVKGQYTRYGRQYNLYNVYKVVTDVSKDGNRIIVDARIVMEPSTLEGLYHSNSKNHSGDGSWERGGGVDAGYVFENFIYGRHPWTNAWPLSGDDTLEYKLIKDKISPNTFLNKYKKSYGDKYFSKHVESTIVNLMKIYF